MYSLPLLLCLSVLQCLSSELACKVTPGVTNGEIDLEGYFLTGFITLNLHFNQTSRDTWLGPSDEIIFLGSDSNTPILRLKANLFGTDHKYEVYRAMRPENDPTAEYKVDIINRYEIFDVPGVDRDMISPDDKNIKLLIRSHDNGTYNLYILGFDKPELMKPIRSEGMVVQPIRETTRIRHTGHKGGPADILMDNITVCDDSNPRLENVDRMEVEPGVETTLSCEGEGPARLVVDWKDQQGEPVNNGVLEYLEAPAGINKVRSILKVVLPMAVEKATYKCIVRNEIEPIESGRSKYFYLKRKDAEKSTGAGMVPLKTCLMSSIIPIAIIVAVGIIWYLRPLSLWLTLMDNIIRYIRQRDGEHASEAEAYHLVTTNDDANTTCTGNGLSATLGDGLRQRPTSDSIKISSAPVTDKEKKAAEMGIRDKAPLKKDDRDHHGRLFS